MKRNNILYKVGLAALGAVMFSSCDSYLDTMPDNRTEIDSEEKVSSLLTSAYLQNGSCILVNEIMSDNSDDMGSSYTQYSSRFLDQAFAWKDITEDDNDAPRMIWEDAYRAIASANQALEAIDEMGGATTTTLKECKGEALISRAYHHFILVNQFCKTYNPSTSAGDMGITYMEKPETTVKPEYSRGTVAEVYEKIDRDIKAALPLIGDSHYKVSKYHFNSQAVYAFAARFYLFYQKWDQAVAYANKCLGSNAKAMLRDWDAMDALGVTNDLTPRTNAYIDATANCNLLISTSISAAGLFESNYQMYTKYSHDKYLSDKEVVYAPNIWGGEHKNMLRCDGMAFQGSGMDRVLVAKLPAGQSSFWEVDPVAKTGYFMVTSVPLKADMTLLERAEAYIMLKQYDKACEDLTTWMQNWTTSRLTLTPDTITKFYQNINYYTWDKPTLKKHLHPSFAIDAEGSVQESMLQCVLNFKRIESVHEGYRWWDVNRYGMVIYRRLMNADGEPEKATDSLLVDDPRRAIQLPVSVIQAGVTPNPRDEK